MLADLGDELVGAFDQLNRAQRPRCDSLLAPEPVTYDLSTMYVYTSSKTGSATAAPDLGSTASFSLVRELGRWKISEIRR
ncbi:MAG: hypothetical protein ACR2LK_04285 [Solirubrobacteraceae bacterium]